MPGPGKGRQQQRGPQLPEFTIHLQCVPENRPGGMKYIKAVALVTHRSGNPPLPLPTGKPREVDFLVDYRSVGRQTLGPDGGARIVRGPIVDPGAYVFRAHLVGTPYWSDPVVFDTETKPEETEETISSKPDKFEARAIGGDGRYTISVMIADSDNRPVKGALVEVYDEKHDPHLIFRGRTNKDGVLDNEPTVSFTEPFRTVIVQTPGFKSQELPLAGPGRKPPPKTPEPTAEQLSGSLWDVIRNARQHALMDMRAASGHGEPEVLTAEHIRLEQELHEQKHQETKARDRQRTRKDAFRLFRLIANLVRERIKSEEQVQRQAADGAVRISKAEAKARQAEAKADSSARRTEATSDSGIKKSEQKTERRRATLQTIRDLFQSFLGWLGARRWERHERRDERDRKREEKRTREKKRGKERGQNPDPDPPQNGLWVVLPAGKRQPPDQRR